MIKYCKAELKDLNGILEVMKDTKYIQFYKKPFENGLREDMLERIFFIAKDEEKIIAYAIYCEPQERYKKGPVKLKKNFVSSAGIGVLSKYRGKGLAIKLKNYTFEELKKMGYKGIYSDVGSDNLSSLKLQEKLGMKLISEHKTDYRAEGILNCVFEKVL